MPNTIHPTQIGSIPTGSSNTSTLFFGRRVTGSTTENPDGAGFGNKGRPDYLENLIITIAQNDNGNILHKGTITLNVNDIIAIANTRDQFPTNLNVTFREILICENNTTKGMLVLGSQTYLTGSA